MQSAQNFKNIKYKSTVKLYAKNEPNLKYALTSLSEDSNHILNEIQIGRFIINHNQIFDAKHAKTTVIHLTNTLNTPELSSTSTWRMYN